MDFSQAVSLRKKYIENQFGFLNGMQQQAVYAVKGPILILAGAGSGKTSVLINRISNMVRFGHSYNSQYFPGDVSDELMEKLQKAVATGEKLTFSEENEIAATHITATATRNILKNHLYVMLLNLISKRIRLPLS